MLERLAAAEPAARSALMQEMVCAQVAQVLRIPEGQLNREAPFRSLGLDSLMGLELRNRIESVLGIRLSATILWNYPTVAALSRFLAAGDGAAPPEEPPPSIDLTAEVNAMSRDELTQMIAAEFEELKDE